MSEFPLVVQVTSLVEFVQEVSPMRELCKVPHTYQQAVVRLGLTETWANSSGIPTKVVSLDVQGVNGRGEIVWLHDNHAVNWAQGEPVTNRDASIYAGMKRMHELVKECLEEQGYAVRGGRYGLPASIKPLRGQFECVRWVKDGDEYRVEVREDA